MKDKLILKDGSEIEMESGASLSDIKVLSDNKPAMVELWDKLTEDNLKEVVVKNGDGTTAGNYSDLVLVGETSTIQGDGTVLTSFNLRKKTDMEKRMDAMESGQEMLVGAVDDLGAATSELAELQGGGLS